MKSRRKKSAPRRPAPVVTATTPANVPPAALSPARRWLYRIIALVGVPLILLGALEAILRLAGFGYNPAFLETVRVGDRDYYINNEDFSLRFFPPSLARWPEPIMFPVQKPPGVCRIFVLGESAARGEPDPNYAASRYLQALLDDRFPPTRFEIINTGITAINSHVILPIARDCARAGGDLWIIYMGNNEMVGPFGAATVFGAQAPPVWLARAALAIQTTRTGQLLMRLARRFHRQNQNQSWTGMQMFLDNRLAPGDPRRDRVHRNFERNLDDIVRCGVDSGAKILLSTVAVNLRDCPPFASLPDVNLSPADAAACTNLFQNAVRLEQQGDPAAAAEKLSAAARLESRRADVQYHWGQCLLALTNFNAARARLGQACDDDALPFRADSAINRSIQDTAPRFPGGRVALCDAAAELAANAPDGICGQETFYEHVHFNFHGNYLLGLAWARQVEKMLPAAIARTAGSGGWATEDTCDQRLALTDWNRCAATDMMMDWLQHPPLSDQPNNAARLRSLHAEDTALRSRFNQDTAQQALAVYEAAIQRSPQDPVLHENFADFLELVGNLNQAAAEWRQVQSLLPCNCESFYQAGRLQSELGQWDAAATALATAVKLRPSLAQGWYELGGVLLATGKYEDALRDYTRALALDPANATYCAYAGKALSRLNRPAGAMKLYRRAIQLQPGLWEAHFGLGDELGEASRYAEAEAEFSQVIRLQPDFPAAHRDRGVMLSRLGRLDEARQEFQETLRLQPDDQPARQDLEQFDDAKAHAR